ncbi:MAG: hypothetical protein P8X96_09290 [Desulfobacteraceae bacterium]
MKKIIVITLALMMVAGLAYAEDRLSLSGSLFVRGWDEEGYSAKYSKSYDSNDEQGFWEQRFRLGGKIAVADDVSVNFRMDLGEGIWGQDYTQGSVARPGTGNPDRVNTKLDIDRAYIHINKAHWELVAGQQFQGLGILQVYDVNSTGFTFRLKFDPVKVSLLYARFDEGGATTDDGVTEDTDRYGFNVSYTTDKFDGNFFYIMGNDGTPVDDSPWAFGLNGSLALGMMNLTGELAYLGGDTAAGAMDYVGLQAYLGANANITETIKLGGDIYYAQGTDDATETQLTNLGDWDDFTPFSFVGVPEIVAFVSAFPSWDAFDPFGISGGVIGADIYAEFALIEKLKFGARVGYFQPSEDANQPGAELIAYNAWINYTIATNTDLGLYYMVSSVDDDSATSFDDARVAIIQLATAF